MNIGVMNKAFDIVFNDEYIVVINKLAPLVVHPTKKERGLTLTRLLEEEIGEKVFPSHRLDRNTSGLIIYAKDPLVQKEIMYQFRRRMVEKKYLAFVKGKLSPPRGIMEDTIIDRDGARYGESPRRAKTLYRVKQVFSDFCVVELTPYTGRTNQLRIQLALRGHPVLEDDKYAFRRDFLSITRNKNGKRILRRLALHAFFISFIHPVSKKRVELKVGLREDMERFLNVKILVSKK